MSICGQCSVAAKLSKSTWTHQLHVAGTVHVGQVQRHDHVSLSGLPVGGTDITSRL